MFVFVVFDGGRICFCMCVFVIYVFFCICGEVRGKKKKNIWFENGLSHCFLNG